MKTWKTGRKTIDIKCENCDESFRKTLSEYKRAEKLKRKHYCSSNCSYEHKKLKPKECLFCGVEFKPESLESKFCSLSCAAKHNNHKRKGTNYLSEDGLKSLRFASELKIKENKELYLQDPKYCKECKGVISYVKRGQVFCNIDCKRKYDRRNVSKYQIYWRQCQFSFNLKKYPNEFDFTLIEEFGWYSPTNKNDNLDGVSRDHIHSIREGFENNIDPVIIKHPANCQLLKHTDNISKNRKSGITIEVLKEKIKHWDTKYIPIII